MALHMNNLYNNDDLALARERAANLPLDKFESIGNINGVWRAESALWFSC